MAETGRVFRQGGSLAITIPVRFVRALGLHPGKVTLLALGHNGEIRVSFITLKADGSEVQIDRPNDAFCAIDPDGQLPGASLPRANAIRRSRIHEPGGLDADNRSVDTDRSHTKGRDV